jgi:sialate O-acetylesterase
MSYQSFPNYFAPRFVAGVISFFCLVTAGELRGDITLPKIFSDHMVLQRDSLVKVWGAADPNQKLVVSFDKQVVKTVANAKGDWAVSVRTPPEGCGPFTLEVAAEDAEAKVLFSDVMVGEVWLCAGEMNMNFKVSQALNSENEIELSKNFNNVRLFSVAPGASVEPLDDFVKVAPWSVCAPETVKDFSATAYFFGRELSKELKEMPIGLIDVSTNGSACEAFCSRASMDAKSELAELLRHWDENDDPASLNRPGNVFNGMIAPMRDFPFRGVIWYQGESNVGRGFQYRTLLDTLIKDWRKTFRKEQLPFYFVQVAPFRYQSHGPEELAEIWDAQFQTLKKTTGTAMVVTTDISDIADISPQNKQEVGRRLSLHALANVYPDFLPKEKTFSSDGPVYEKMSTMGNRIRITFQNSEYGLKVAQSEEELNCFAICGEDKEFIPANAKIVGDSIEVSSPQIDNPIAVRFAWEDTAQPNLVNSEGLPASPFRTDDFPLQSEGRDF